MCLVFFLRPAAQTQQWDGFELPRNAAQKLLPSLMVELIFIILISSTYTTRGLHHPTCATQHFSHKAAQKGTKRVQHTAFGRAAGIELAVACVSPVLLPEPSYGN